LAIDSLKDISGLWICAASGVVLGRRSLPCHLYAPPIY
jgi:hypothetical protein